MIDERLCKTVIRNVGKAMRLFCLKSEQLIVVDGNATQVIGNVFIRDVVAGGG